MKKKANVLCMQQKAEECSDGEKGIEGKGGKGKGKVAEQTKCE